MILTRWSGLPQTWLSPDRRNWQSSELKAAANSSFHPSPHGEVGVSFTKKSAARRPPLNGQPPELWFRTNLKKFRAQLTPFSVEIASESARLPALSDSGDPGECILMATAHVLDLSLITRDRRIIDLAKNHPEYLTVIGC